MLEQNDVAGQRKKVDVKDYPSSIELANVLKDVNLSCRQEINNKFYWS